MTNVSSAILIEGVAKYSHYERCRTITAVHLVPRGPAGPGVQLQLSCTAVLARAQHLHEILCGNNT